MRGVAHLGYDMGLGIPKREVKFEGVGWGLYDSADKARKLSVFF